MLFSPLHLRSNLHTRIINGPMGFKFLSFKVTCDPVMGLEQGAVCTEAGVIESRACAEEPVSSKVPLSSGVICFLGTLALRPPSAPVSAFHANIVQASEQSLRRWAGRREDLVE